MRMSFGNKLITYIGCLVIADVSFILYHLLSINFIPANIFAGIEDNSNIFIFFVAIYNIFLILRLSLAIFCSISLGSIWGTCLYCTPLSLYLHFLYAIHIININSAELGSIRVMGSIWGFIILYLLIFISSLFILTLTNQLIHKHKAHRLILAGAVLLLEIMIAITDILFGTISNFSLYFFYVINVIIIPFLVPLLFRLYRTIMQQLYFSF